MTNVQTGLLYFSVVVSALYLVAGGYKSIRAYFQKNLMMLSQPKHPKPPRNNPQGRILRPYFAQLQNDSDNATMSNCFGVDDGRERHFIG